MSPITKTQQLLRIKNDFRDEHDNRPASARTMIDWAIDTGRYALDLAKARRRAAEELTDAMRSEMTTDAHGEPIRVNLAYETDDGWLWDQRDTITRGAVEVHLTRGRRLVYGEIKAHVLTARDYSESHPDEPPVQYSLNFAADLADDGITLPTAIELEQLLGQPPAAPRGSERSHEPSHPSSHPSDRA